MGVAWPGMPIAIGALKMRLPSRKAKTLKRCSLTTMWPFVASITAGFAMPVCGIECFFW